MEAWAVRAVWPTGIAKIEAAGEHGEARAQLRLVRVEQLQVSVQVGVGHRVVVEVAVVVEVVLWRLVGERHPSLFERTSCEH